MAGERGFPLPAELVARLATHLAMTLRWSRAMSLTSIRTPAEAVRRHVLESLQAAAHLNPGAGALLDIGSGNGYPALPMKCLHPALRVILLEPALRRSIFLESVIRTLGLQGAEVRRERVDRASDLDPYAGTGNISMRGVNAPGAVISGSRRLLPPGGRVLLLTSRRTAEATAGSLPAGLRVLAMEPLTGGRLGCLLALERTSSPIS